ncbi:MAG TPA: hypothetical protein VF796_05670 [Humisphaera sp.]
MTFEVGLTLGTAIVCTSLELLNVAAGGPLPWRYAGYKRWCPAPAPYYYDTPVFEVLDTWAIPLHAMVLAGLLLGVWLARRPTLPRRWRAVAWVCVVTHVAAGAVAAYSRYWAYVVWYYG